MALKSLKCNLKCKLLSSLAKAIKACAKFDTKAISYERIHEMFNRATPEKFLLYKHAIAPYKLYWSPNFSIEFEALDLNTVLTSRKTIFLLVSYIKMSL